MGETAGETIRPLRRVEYDKLVLLGAFQDERIELLDGALVAMSPIAPSHGFTVQKLTARFVLALSGRAAVRVQSPFAASELSEPEPDVAIVPQADYRSDHPARAFLIVEVAQSSLARDRGKKRRIYAECGVPEYWIVNLFDGRVEIFTEPAGGAYRSVAYRVAGESIRLSAFPDVELEVSEFLV